MTKQAMNSKPKFELGTIYMTAGVSETVENYGIELQPYLRRHQYGDWGSVCAEDQIENELSLKQGFRLLSAYSITVQGDEFKFWIITEADRLVTTVLLPSEY